METTRTEISNSELEVLNEALENYFANTIIPQLFVDGNLVLRKFTPPAMKQFTLSPEHLNKSIEAISDNFRYPTLIENINEVIATGVVLEKEVQTTDKRWYQMNILPYLIRKENKTDGVIITFVDITKRIATLNELEHLNNVLDTMLYALSHDLRQPLTTIRLLPEELALAYDRRDSNQFQKWMETLKRASENMTKLLEDFTAHMKEPAIADENQRLDIGEIFNDVAVALKNDIHKYNVEIQTDFHTSEIFFPRKNLRSIVFNLISNAIKYRKCEEPLKIIMSTIKQPEHVVLSITDNGMGIDPNDQKIIFDKFSRLNKNIDGTGMGLYIINRMLADKGGKVEVESVMGEGSSFHIYFKNSY